MLVVATCLCHRVTALDLVPPADSVSFGWDVKFLPSGNLVVMDPFAGSANQGAVYLYRPNGSLITTLRGDRENDEVGDGGIVILDDGNFVVLSRAWHADVQGDASAVTWIDAERGLSGVVSSANSLIGGNNCNVFPLRGGDYYVECPYWTDDPALPGKGAFAWITGGKPATGHFSAKNALVGTRAHEDSHARRLTNGNVVVLNRSWAPAGSQRNLGAATFFSSKVRPIGFASAANSLVGAHDDDGLDLTDAALANGNYVVSNPTWSRDGIEYVGAVTWGDGDLGVHGVVSEQNSIVGRHANDRIAWGGNIRALSNGNYVILSPFWHNDANDEVGAATWVDGSARTVGEVAASNSITGAVGANGIDATALANGNYVLMDNYWNNGALTAAGAVTWADGTRPTSATISAANSIVGTEAFELVGFVTALSNGDYLIAVPNHDENRGAVLWEDGRVATSGSFSGTNALVGSTPGDRVGDYVFALSDGNYVVTTPNWRDAAHSEVGAVTWAAGNHVTRAVVSPANSLVGSHDGDRVGGCAPDDAFCFPVTVLPQGAYLVASPYWDDGTLQNVGAVNLLAGGAPLAGIVSEENSLIGSGAHEAFGYAAPEIFDDGIAIFLSMTWDTGKAIVAPRRLAGGITGAVGSGSEDVISPTQGGGGSVRYDYDPRHGLMVVADSGSNFVTIRPIIASVEYDEIFGADFD